MGSAAAALLPAVLTAEGLEHIANHKYQPGKYTPLDLLLNPFWQGIADSLPLWLAPNLVTLLGFLPTVVSYSLVWQASPHYDEPASAGLALFTALAVFFYQTMDAVDGKQARRTNSSTPLGQLFDHGFDCMACLSHHSVASMVFLPGASWWGPAGLAALQTGFFLAQWQEYHTGVLSTSFGPVGVTETQYGLMLVALSGAVFGPQWVQAGATVPMRVPFSSDRFPLGVVGIQGWVAFCAVLCALSLWTTLRHAAKVKGMSGVVAAALHLVPVAALNVLILLWEPTVLRHSARKLCFLTGLLFFYYTVQMILFSMARMPFPILQPTLAPYAALAALSWLLGPNEMGVAMGLATAATGCRVLVWLLTVIQELKAKLGISVLFIKPARRSE